MNNLLAICFMSILVLMAGPTRAQSTSKLEQADAYYDAKNHEQALPLYQALCEAGEAAGCVGQAKSLRLLSDQFRYPAQAIKVLNRSCDLEYGPGCSRLAEAYLMGDGVQQSSAQARTFFERGCSLGYREGCHDMGLQTGYGQLGETNHKARAVTILSANCKAGYVDSCVSARNYMSDGKYSDGGIALIRRACDLDVKWCRNVALSYEQRVKTPTNPAETRADEAQARIYHQRACDANYRKSCQAIAAKQSTAAPASKPSKQVSVSPVKQPPTRPATSAPPKRPTSKPVESITAKQLLGGPGYREGQRTSFSAMMKAFSAKQYEEAMESALASCVEEFEWEACMMVDVLVYTNYRLELSQGDISELYDSVSSACIAGLKKACGPAMSLLYAANPPDDYSSAINRLSIICRDMKSSKDRACKAIRRLRTHQKIDAVKADWQCDDNMGRTVDGKIGVSAYNRIVNARNSLGKCHTRELENRFRRLNDIVNEYDGYVRIDGNRWTWNVNAGCDCFDKLTQKMNALNDREIRFVKRADQKMETAKYWLDRYRD